MHFEPDEIYHVYNRGNNKAPIFFNHENYTYFLRKVRKEWLPFCEVVSYCLMPNHFHFTIQPHEEACEYLYQNDQPSNLQHLSKVIGKTLSSYTKAINAQNNTTGSLFQKKTKAKCLNQFSPGTSVSNNYLVNCFHYIHQNPLAAHLVTSLYEWPYSSWMDYYGHRKSDMCNRDLGLQLLGLSQADLFEQFPAGIETGTLTSTFYEILPVFTGFHTYFSHTNALAPNIAASDSFK